MGRTPRATDAEKEVFAARLKKIREATDLAWPLVAALSNIPIGTINNWVQGKGGYPTGRQERELAAVFGCDVAELYKEPDRPVRFQFSRMRPFALVVNPKVAADENVERKLREQIDQANSDHLRKVVRSEPEEGA